MYDISISDNYINIVNESNDNITDRPLCDIVIAKKYVDSTNYTVYYKNSVIDQLCGIEWDDFTLNGVDFLDQQAFEDWKNENTGCSGSSGGGGVTPTPVYQTQTPVMRSNISVPSGFTSVIIMRLSGTVTIDTGDGTNILGGGALPRSISLSGEEFGDINGILPAITITGGTWQWTALPQL